MFFVCECLIEKIYDLFGVFLFEIPKKTLDYPVSYLRYLDDSRLAFGGDFDVFGPLVGGIRTSGNVPFLFKAFQSPAGVASVDIEQVRELILRGCAALLAQKHQQARLRMIEPQGGKAPLGGRVAATGEHADHFKKREEARHFSLRLDMSRSRQLDACARIYMTCQRRSAKMDDEKIHAIFGPVFDAVSHDGMLVLEDLGLPADAAILDVGTGAGKFAIFLALQGYHVTTGEPSTDTSHYAGQDWALNAEKLGVRDKIRFEAFDASHTPFESATFDAVFFFGVLHHIDEGVRSDVLHEALRIAKEDGAVVFFEPREETLEKVWVDDPDHPLAANPSDYLDGKTLRERRIEGSLMNIFIYEKAA